MSKKRKEKNNKPVDRQPEFQASIQALLDEASGKGFSFKQIVKKLNLKKKDDIKIAGFALDTLYDQKKITQSNEGVYLSTRTAEELTGTVDHVSSRFAYIRIGEGREDIYVKGSDLGSAVDGDTVSLKLLHGRHGDHEEGRVTKVLKRNRERFVGKVEVSKNFAFVVPDYRKMHTDFFVYPENVNDAKNR